MKSCKKTNDYNDIKNIYQVRILCWSSINQYTVLISHMNGWQWINWRFATLLFPKYNVKVIQDTLLVLLDAVCHGSQCQMLYVIKKTLLEKLLLSKASDIFSYISSRARLAEWRERQSCWLYIKCSLILNMPLVFREWFL